MTEKQDHVILFVDDEESILRSLARLFRREGHKILTATSGEEGLQILEKEGGTVCLIVSDQKMPRMNGAAFLEQAKIICPDAMRFLLTGYSEMDAIVAAVNKGQIHRYLAKPWNDNDLIMQVNSAIEQYDLVQENRRLLALTKRQNRQLFEFGKTMERKIEERSLEISEKNKKLEYMNKELEYGILNTVRAFAALTEMHTPYMKGHGKRVSSMASDMAKKMGMGEDEVTQVEIAGILHDIGTIGFPMDLLEKRMEDRCSREEAEQYKRHSEEGQNIIAFINRLDTVGILIRHHHERYDGKGFPDRLLEGEIPVGARIIAVADRYDRIMNRKVKKNDPLLENFIKGSTLNVSHFSEEELVQQAAIHHIKQNVFIEFDPDVVKAFLAVLDDKGINPSRERSLTFPELESGMILTRPVYSSRGRFLLPGNTTLSETVIAKLKTFYDNNETPALFFTMVR